MAWLEQDRERGEIRHEVTESNDSTHWPLYKHKYLSFDKDEEGVQSCGGLVQKSLE